MSHTATLHCTPAGNWLVVCDCRWISSLWPTREDAIADARAHHPRLDITTQDRDGSMQGDCQ